MLLKKGSLVLSGVFLFVAWNALLLLFLWGWPPVGRPAEGGGAEPGGGEEWGLRGRRGSGGLAVDFIRLAERVEAELETQKRLLQQIHSHWALRKRKKEDELKKTEQLSIPPQKDTAFADVDQSKGKSPHDLIVSHKRDNKVLFNENYSAGSAAASQVIIPILVIACDRVTVKRCLDKLIEYRPSAELHPIIVSQDCGHTETAHVIQSYGSLVTHLSQPDLSDILVRREHKKFKGYYKISRHYRWALNQVFNSFLHSSVVVVEDDLEVAPDFFEYFRALHPILRSDPTLWCVSAWNDNGRDGLVDMRKAELLYRTDFFPGLGWMLLKELWAELEPKWPVAFWDDWMRQPDQRRDRSCIRPEISRTITFGRRGVSLGQFFDQYLRYIKLSTEFVLFTKLDLSYLVNERYNEMFEREVYFAPLVKVEELQAGGKLKGEGPFRVQYSSRDGFKVMARSLGVMEDLKSGVPRAGYRGVVSFLARGRRIYLAPPPGWSHYDTSWS